MSAFDAIVIGAGHNGMTAARVLAGKGVRVCVVERADFVGGMAMNADFAGATVPRLAHLLYNLSGDAGVATKQLPTVGLSPDGRHMLIENGALSFADGARHPDADAFAALYARLVRFAGLLGQLANAPPPALWFHRFP